MSFAFPLVVGRSSVYDMDYLLGFGANSRGCLVSISKVCLTIKIFVEHAGPYHPFNLVMEVMTLFNRVALVFMVLGNAISIFLACLPPHGVWPVEAIQTLHQRQ